MKLLVKMCLVAAVILGVTVSLNSCSQEDRDEMINRAKNAADALNGGDKIAEKAHETPLIVQEQQKKEQKRQNLEWTPENQKRYPLEFCHAQLLKLDRMSEEQEVVAYRLAMQLSKVKRGIGDEGEQLKNITSFLAKAKADYEAAVAGGAKTMKLGGVTMPLDVAKKKIVEAYHRRKNIEGGATGKQNQILDLEKRLAKVQQEQKKLAATKQRIEIAMEDIRVKQAVDGGASISASLGELQDAVNALVGDVNEPTLDELVSPSPAASIDEDFNAFMNE